MYRKLILTAAMGMGLMAGIAAPAVQAGGFDRDRDGRHDRRDEDRGRDRKLALPDPGALTGFRGQIGQSFYFEVTGNVNAGQVWGTGLYTDDSALAAAVVHAGLLKDGQTGVVKVTILQGAPSYAGTARYGVASGDWGGWDGSYRVDR
jgi:hypothetical protein